MKKKLSFILLLITTFIFNINVYALTPEDIVSREALVVDLNTEEVLFAKNTTDEAVPIASLTKLMTFAVVVDEIPDIYNTRVTVPKGMQKYMESRSASVADLLDGYSYTVYDLLQGVMLPSGCDAAETLALYIGNNDTSVFVAKMNAKAKELGMYNTLYLDSFGIGLAEAPDGITENLSTEQDLYILARYLYKNVPCFREIIKKEYVEIIGEKDDKKDYDLIRNTNYLIGEYSGDEYYYPYAIGGKTGSLYVAGKCLITFAEKNGREVVAITLGVEGQFGDYNLTDHIKIFDYIFLEKEEENITIDLGPEYRSVEIGKQHKIEATTSSETPITWTSSDPGVATVDENGIVTGISQGQTKITATTKTGNIAYTFVSVNFYNGIHIKNSSGPELQEGWDSVDFSIIKNKGYDYVIIRAGYDTDVTDKNFYKNFQSAIDNDMNIGIWFEGYAKTVEVAEQEAYNLLSILEQVSDKKDKINLPVFYNLYFSKANINDLSSIAKAFNDIVSAKGYKVILELGRTKLSSLDLNELKENGIDLSIIWRSVPPDFKTTMEANETEANVWNYKSSIYLRNTNLTKNGMLSVMYMNYMKLNTIHKEYIPVVIIDDETTIEDLTNRTEPTNTTSNVILTSNEDNTTKEPLNISISSIKNNSKSTNNNKSKDKDIKEEKTNNFLLPIIIILIIISVGVISIIVIENEDK